MEAWFLEYRRPDGITMQGYFEKDSLRTNMYDIHTVLYLEKCHVPERYLWNDFPTHEERINIPWEVDYPRFGHVRDIGARIQHFIERNELWAIKILEEPYKLDNREQRLFLATAIREIGLKNQENHRVYVQLKAKMYERV